MFRRIGIAAVVTASAIAFGGAAQGRSAHPTIAPSGNITCNGGVGQARFTQPLSVNAAVGNFNVIGRGTFGGCTVGAGDPVIGGTATSILRSGAGGPRSCPAGVTFATYDPNSGGGPNSATIKWWSNNPVNGQVETYTSTSNHLISITNTPGSFVISEQWRITGGTAAALVGNTFTVSGTLTQPDNVDFVNDCTLANKNLKGEGLTGGTLTVP
jgi:hypothetical protein